MFSQDDQVLDIYYAITPRHWADVAQRLTRAPIVNHDAHVAGIDNSVPVKVNDWDDWCLPYIPATIPGRLADDKE
jgi:hypothetical protein